MISGMCLPEDLGPLTVEEPGWLPEINFSAVYVDPFQVSRPADEWSSF